MSDQEINKYLHYGSNDWLLQFRDYISKLIDERKKYTHELYLLIIVDDESEFKSICYTSNPIELLKKEGRKIISYNEGPYKCYRVYLRRFEDNHTILLATKNEKTLIEITVEYIKLTNGYCQN
jgi:hypothetical protein